MKIKLDPGAYMPERAHDTDAGLDIRSTEDKMVQAHSYATFRTGVHIRLPEGCAGLLVSKSGLCVNCNITSTGLIDEGYDGQIIVKLFNHGWDDYHVHRGDKITQLVVIPVRYEAVELVDDLEQESARGSGGFGSTGR